MSPAQPSTHEAATAYHEAAHAVVAEATGYGNVLELRLTGEVGTFAAATVRSLGYPYEHLLVGDPDGEAYLRAHLLYAVAGFAANKVRGDAPLAWDEEVQEGEDGYLAPAGECELEGGGTDYEKARVLAHMLGGTVERALAEATALLVEPEVWGAVEHVAEELLASDDGALGRDEFAALVADSGLDRYRTTDLGRAKAVARERRRGW